MDPELRVNIISLQIHVCWTNNLTFFTSKNSLLTCKQCLHYKIWPGLNFCSVNATNPSRTQVTVTHFNRFFLLHCKREVGRTRVSFVSRMFQTFWPKMTWAKFHGMNKALNWRGGNSMIPCCFHQGRAACFRLVIHVGLVFYQKFHHIAVACKIWYKYITSWDRDHSEWSESKPEDDVR